MGETGYGWMRYLEVQRRDLERLKCVLKYIDLLIDMIVDRNLFRHYLDIHCWKHD